MDQAIAKQWVDALRSGEYKQGRHLLRAGDSFCCLGVLCNLHAQAHPEVAARQGSKGQYMGRSAKLPLEVKRWAGMNSTVGTYGAHALDLTRLNDGAGYSFEQIANVIDREWRRL